MPLLHLVVLLASISTAVLLVVAVAASARQP